MISASNTAYFYSDISFGDAVQKGRQFGYVTLVQSVRMPNRKFRVTLRKKK